MLYKREKHSESADLLQHQLAYDLWTIKGQSPSTKMCSSVPWPMTKHFLKTSLKKFRNFYSYIVRHITAGYDVTSEEEGIQIQLIGLKQNAGPGTSGQSVRHWLLLWNDRLWKGTAPSSEAKAEVRRGVHSRSPPLCGSRGLSVSLTACVCPKLCWAPFARQNIASFPDFPGPDQSGEAKIRPDSNAKDTLGLALTHANKTTSCGIFVASRRLVFYSIHR